LHKFPYAGRDDNNGKNLGLDSNILLQLLDAVKNPEHALYFGKNFSHLIGW